jgi:hypothetical protein
LVWQRRVATQAGSGASADIASFFPTETLSLSLAESRKKPRFAEPAHGAQTYVLAQDLRVLGYYSLAAGSVVHDEATERVKKCLARHPIPVILFAGLAIDAPSQGKGSAQHCLKTLCCGRHRRQIPSVHGRYIVHAKDDSAKGFYEHFDFEPSPSDSYQLLLLIMKDLVRIVGK